MQFEVCGTTGGFYVVSVAVGTAYIGGIILLLPYRFFSTVRYKPLAGRHSGEYVSGEQTAGDGHHKAAGSGHSVSFHDRNGQCGRSGNRHLVRRTWGGILDVGQCPAGYDDRLCGKDTDFVLAAAGNGRKLAGRTHVLHFRGDA